MNKEEILNQIERLENDIKKLESKTGKNRKKGTAFVIKEKQEFINFLKGKLQ